MIENLRTLAIVPARGGSKRVPRKNIRPLGGKPLICWTIEAAHASTYIDRVVVSSDDDEILAVAAACDPSSPLKRPAEIASDVASSVDVVMHVLDAAAGYDLAVLLQPTSPLRTAADIDGSLSTMLSRGATSCISVCPVQEHPYWMYGMDENGHLASLIEGSERFTRHQDLPPVYSPNGAIYAFRTDWMRETRDFHDRNTIGYVMPRERSIDIDTEDDFVSAEWYFARHK